MFSSNHKHWRWIAVALLVIGVSAAIWRHFIKAKADSENDNANSVTFARDVAPIIFEKCSTCHHPGDAAPFSFLTYDDVRHRARQIVEVTRRGFMPPWLPKSGHGEFVGVRSLTPQELRILDRWVDGGAPLGASTEMPKTPATFDAWKADPPDLVLETPAYSLSGEGRDVFRNFVVPIKLDAPRWIQAIEIRPDNPKVTHHARLGVDSSNESIRRDAEDAEPGYSGMAWGQDPDGQLVIWAPGMAASPATHGFGWRLYPKSCLVLHAHLQPSGKPEVVKFRVGIRYSKEPPTIRPVILRIGSCDIDIPAGVRRHDVIDQYILPIDVDVHTIFPHAHSRCREMSVVAERPDGSREQLITIEHFDENWHDLYRYRHPVRLPRGTRLLTNFAYDNSDANARNGFRPSQRVVYGSNANDEMADVYLQVTAVRADQRAKLVEDHQQYELNSHAAGHRCTLELYPDDPWSQEGLATCFVGQGEFGKAILALEQRLKLGPKAVFPVASLGMAFLASGDAIRAEARQREAIAMDEQYPLAWFGLGKALVVQKKIQSAEQAFRRAAELAPGFVDARLSLVDLLVQSGRLDQAKDICRLALRESPDLANIHMKMAEICAKQKRFDECFEFCKSAKICAPYTHPSKVLLAMFHAANGDPERGVTLMREARIESPDHPVPALMLGQFARQLKQAKTALAHISAAADIPAPDNWPESHKKRFLILLHSERFQLAQQLQDLEMARDALSQWLKCEPNNRQIQQLLESLPKKPGA